VSLHKRLDSLYPLMLLTHLLDELTTVAVILDAVEAGRETHSPLGRSMVSCTYDMH
jgi:hypothetical protein